MTRWYQPVGELRCTGLSHSPRVDEEWVVAFDEAGNAWNVVFLLDGDTGEGDVCHVPCTLGPD